MQISPKIQDLPLKMVGSTKFGRYQKISVEQTFNLIESDGWMVPYAGYSYITGLSQSGVGRGIYTSTKTNMMFSCVGNQISRIDSSLTKSNIANISSSAGDVFIDENNGNQIAICDKLNIFIYNYQTNTFTKATDGTGPNLNFTPGFIAFQDGYFIAPDTATNQWRLSNPNDGTVFPPSPNFVGELQTKPDNSMAVVRFPGQGNLAFVFGKTVTEQWIDTGIQLFPYQRNSFSNIDFGCLNQATIASNDKMVVWLGFNAKSGPVIMMSDGQQSDQISNDGINFKLSQLTNPSDAFASMFKQDGHIIYQITFPSDNLCYAYDFNTEKFYTVTDEFLNIHIAKRVVSFNDSYYFVSIRDGNLYEFNSKYTSFTYNDPFQGIIQKEIPRIRICPTISMGDRTRFVMQNYTFPIEQGENLQPQRVDLSISKDGGQTFSNFGSVNLNSQGNRQNRLNFWPRTSGNEITPMFRFGGYDRTVFTDGVARIYQ